MRWFVALCVAAGKHYIFVIYNAASLSQKLSSESAVTFSLTLGR